MSFSARILKVVFREKKKGWGKGLTLQALRTGFTLQALKSTYCYFVWKDLVSCKVKRK